MKSVLGWLGFAILVVLVWMWIFGRIPGIGGFRMPHVMF